MSGGGRAAAAAAAFYLAVALWAMRVVLPAPASTFAYSRHLAPEPASAMVSHSDQMFVAWGVTRNARTFLTRPCRLFDGEQCHPTPKAVTLGESMFGDGLLGLLPYAISRDPIFTLNAVAILVLWLPAIAMYALVRHLTGSAGAAFVAGLLFGFHPTRVMDPGHPFVYGNHWTPFALLFAHRLFERARWRDAGGLALFVALQLLESFYQIVALALLGAVIGAWLLVRHRRRLASLAPKLLVAGAAIALFTAALTRPYLETRATWNILGGRFSFLHLPGQFAPGSFAYPGTVLVGLAVVAVIDRARRRRGGAAGDPRLAYLLAGLAVFWLVVFAIPIPGLGVVPSLTMLLARVVPGLDAVRGLQYARLGIYLAGAVLAGWGGLVLLEPRGVRGRAAITAALAAAALVEVFAPVLAQRSFGTSVELVAYPVRPAPELVALLERVPEGAVLDLPFEKNMAGELRDMAHFLLLAAFHDHPVAACYNSYKLPIDKDIESLAGRLPEPRAADALAAIGFGAVILHEELEPERVAPSRNAVQQLLGADGRLAPVGQAARHSVYRLSSPLPVEPSFAALAAAGATSEPVGVSAPLAHISFGFRNPTAATYRHPDPITPTLLVARWYRPGGALVAQYGVRALLPLALAPGDEAARTIDVPVPGAADGVFDVTLAPDAVPDRVLARQRVRVTPS